MVCYPQVDYNNGFEDVRETRDVEEEVVYDGRGDEEVNLFPCYVALCDLMVMTCFGSSQVEYVEQDTTVETNVFGGETVETETEVFEEVRFLRHAAEFPQD